MNVIQLSRGSGKSTLALSMAKSSDYPIVVIDEARMAALGNMCEILYGEWKPEIITIKDLLNMPRNSHSGLIIDDADHILESLLGINSHNITITTL